MKITKQQFDELTLASDLEQALKAVGIEVEDDKFPQDGDVYFFADTDGEIDERSWSNLSYDRFLQSIGNVHRTKDDAEHYEATTLRRWQAEIAIRRWRDEHCPFTRDWADEGQWHRIYMHNKKAWANVYGWISQDPFAIYFNTEADLNACAEALPDEWNALLID